MDANQEFKKIIALRGLHLQGIVGEVTSGFQNKYSHVLLLVFIVLYELSGQHCLWLVGSGCEITAMFIIQVSKL